MSVLSYDEAAARVRAEAAKLNSTGTEEVSLQQARGRVLAEPVTADRDQPPFPRAPPDGFAARAADWPGPLRVAGMLRAGESWSSPVPERACLEIMTGAPVPPELDTVAMVEHCTREGDRVILDPDRSLKPGENIVARGAEALAGAVLVPAGTRLTVHGLAVAAACGYPRLRVFVKPRVAILATGDELVELTATPLPHQIRNSNTWTLAAQVEELGGEPVMLPPAPDDAQALRAALDQALAGAEMLLVSGGVSMGKFDMVEPALADLGARFHFTGAKIQPGKPVVFGSAAGKPFFGLPGNPVSTMVCFALFAAPVLAALGGEPEYALPFAEARLSKPLGNKPGLTRFLPALHTHPEVDPVAWQGSGDLAATARANCFLVVPPDAEGIPAGAAVSILLS